LLNVFRLNPEIFYIDQKLAIYRVNENSMVRDIVSMKKGFLQAIRKQQTLLQRNSIEHKLLSNKLTQVLHSYSFFKLGRMLKMLFPGLSFARVKNEWSHRLSSKT
jgi:hypothetical protein